jgi:hypothetical protein
MTESEHDLCYGYTRDELSAAFDLVKNRENWKLPVQACVPGTADVKVISAAVTFFTGSIPEILPVTADGEHAGWEQEWSGDHPPFWYVTARGYYADIGA